MIARIHEFLGLSAGPPRWLRKHTTLFIVLGGIGLFGLKFLSPPTPEGYFEAVIHSTPTKTYGLIRGEIFVANLGDSELITLRSSLRMPRAKEGDLVCLQKFSKGNRTSFYFVTAHSRNCSGSVTVTFFSVI